MNQPRVVLAIESAVSGGSISVLKDGIETASSTGSANISRAEDLLPNINAMLIAEQISRHEIDLIAVSAGPGSFTGIRIGLATALGLKAGLGIEMSSVSVLEAMATASRTTHRELVTAVPMGRDTVCLQSFCSDGMLFRSTDAPHTISEYEFVRMAQGEHERHFVVPSSLFDKTGPSPAVTDFGRNLSFALGLSCLQKRSAETVEPIFVSKSF